MKTCSRCHTVRPLEQFKPGSTYCIWCVHEGEPYAESLEHIDPPKALEPVALHKRQTPMQQLVAVTEEIGGYDDERFDAVKFPEHYQGHNGLQAIDVIRSFSLGYELGNVVKYTLRAGKKGDAKAEIQDLRKAVQYLNFRIEQLQFAQLGQRTTDTKTGGKK